MSTSMSFSKIVRAITEARAGDEQSAHLCVVGAAPELARVVAELSAGAADQRGGVSSSLDALPPADFPRDAALAARWDVVVVLAAGVAAAEMAPVVHSARRAGARLVALIAPPHGAWADAAGVLDDEVAHSLASEHGSSPTLESGVIHAAGDGAAKLAVELPALRRAFCDRVILANAAQNAVIGALVFLPGADMPAMTANQIRMVLKIAAAHGEELGFDRALEILSIVGTAFVFRALARQALDFVPGFGWALKGSVGFTGTIALGEAAIAYFEAGAPLQLSRMQRINRQVERLRSRLPGFLRGGVAPG